MTEWLTESLVAEIDANKRRYEAEVLAEMEE